jgi:hypothetical protein
MQIATAIKVIQKDAEFLGMDFLAMMKFIQKSPMAQTKNTMEAYQVIMEQGVRMFSPVDQ